MGGLPGVAMMLLGDARLDLRRAVSVCAAGWDLSVERDSLAIFLLGVAVFTVALTPEFINLDARFALFAQEMLRNGPSFFPTTYGVPYPDYPATSTFLIYLASLPFQRVTPLTAVLPTAVAAALVLVVTYRIGAIRSRRRGLAAILFTLFTIEFFGMSRSVALDHYTSLAAVLCFYLVYSADCFDRRMRLCLLPVVWALGFAFRGPVGFAIPAAVTCLYLLWNGRFKQTLLVAIAAAAVLILCFAGLLLAAKTQGGTPFLKRVIAAQMMGRFGHRGPSVLYYWYAALTSYAVTYPLAIVVLVSRFRDVVHRRTENDRLLGSLMLWVLVVLIAMSIPATKKTRYIMPIVPALSLIASFLTTDASTAGLLSRTRHLFLRICSSLPVVFAVGVAGLSVFASLCRPEWRTCSLVTLALLIPLALLVWTLDRDWRRISDRGIVLLAVGVAAFAIVHIGVAGPIGHSFERTVPFVRQVEALLDKDPGTVFFFRVGPDNEDVKFMANLSKPLEPRFLDSLNAVWDTAGVSYVISEGSEFHSLEASGDASLHLLVRGKIGHGDFAVFAQDQER